MEGGQIATSIRTYCCLSSGDGFTYLSIVICFVWLVGISALWVPLVNLKIVADLTMILYIVQNEVK